MTFGAAAPGALRSARRSIESNLALAGRQLWAHLV